MAETFEYADEPESQITKEAVEHLTKLLGDKENFLARLCLVNTIVMAENDISFGTAIIGLLTAYRIVHKGKPEKMLEVMAGFGMMATSILEDVKDNKKADVLSTLIGGIMACNDIDMNEVLDHLTADFPGLKEQWDAIQDKQGRVH